MNEQTQKNVPEMLIIHHTADNNPRDQLANINSWHEQRGFPLSSLGFYVGYHYVINHYGVVTQTRADDEEGAHTHGQNFNSIGIALEGNFNMDMPSQAQIVSLKELMRRLADEYGLGVTDIYPHRQYNSTGCYGSLLSNDWCREVFLEDAIGQTESVVATEIPKQESMIEKIAAGIKEIINPEHPTP